MKKLPYTLQKWDYIKNELLQIEKRLKKSIEIYLIGGCAMSHYGNKDATKDIDVLFKNKYDCADFFNAATELGYETAEQYFPPLLEMEATFFVYKGDEIWIDLFVKNVMNKFELTPSIQKRAVKTNLSTKKLKVYCLDPHDIFLFKSITPRERDENDLIVLLTKTSIDFSIIHKEIRIQSKNFKGLKEAFNTKMEKLDEKGLRVEYIK
jgi:predicted nucleotidyltransferase